MFDKFAGIGQVMSVIKGLRHDSVPMFLDAFKEFLQAESLADQSRAGIRLLQVFAEGSTTQIDDLSLGILRQLAETQMFDYVVSMVEKTIDKGKDLFSVQSLENDEELEAAQAEFETQGLSWVGILMIVEIVSALIVGHSKMNQD